MPKNPAGRSDEEQAQHEKSMMEHNQWLARENVRAARGTSTAITDYNAPSPEEQASAKAFLENWGIGGTPPANEDFGEQMVKPEVKPDMSKFLSPDISGGYYQEPRGGSKYTGKPQTFEEQQFVQDYFSKYGVKPVVGQGNEFQQTGTYDPNSTMGGLGFTNYDEYVKAQQRGEPYGLRAGADVPYNAGIVVTDEKGNPIARYMDINKPEVQKAIAEGRYINPIAGPLSEQLQGGFPGGENVYNQPPVDMQNLGDKELLGQYNVPQYYLAGLSDYLDAQVRNDRPNVDAVYNQIDAVKKEAEAAYTKATTAEEANQIVLERDAQLDELYDQIDNVLMTDDRAKQEYAKANDLVLQGTPMEQLPFLEQVTPTMVQLSAAEQKRQFDIAKGAQPAPWTGYATQRQAPQGNPIKLFLDYSESLDTTPEYRRWLKNNYEYYKSRWEASGEPEFIPWLNDTLARG